MQRTVSCESKKSHEDSVWGARRKRGCRWTESTESKSRTSSHGPAVIHNACRRNSIWKAFFVFWLYDFRRNHSLTSLKVPTSDTTHLQPIERKRFRVEATLHNFPNLFDKNNLFPLRRSCQPSVFGQLLTLQDTSPIHQRTCSTPKTPNVLASNSLPLWEKNNSF